MTRRGQQKFEIAGKIFTDIMKKEQDNPYISRRWVCSQIYWKHIDPTLFKWRFAYLATRLPPYSRSENTHQTLYLHSCRVWEMINSIRNSIENGLWILRLGAKNLCSHKIRNKSFTRTHTVSYNAFITVFFSVKARCNGTFLWIDYESYNISVR